MRKTAKKKAKYRHWMFILWEERKGSFYAYITQGQFTNMVEIFSVVGR